MRRRDSAAMVSKTSELLPDPDTPVKTVSSRFGRSTSTLRRLFSPAPRTRIVPQAGASSAVMRGRWYREGRPDRFGARQPPAVDPEAARSPWRLRGERRTELSTVIGKLSIFLPPPIHIVIVETSIFSSPESGRRTIVRIPSQKSKRRPPSRPSHDHVG